MNQDIEAAQESDDFFKFKMAHARLNQRKLKRALKKREDEDKLDKNFLDRSDFCGCRPLAHIRTASGRLRRSYLVTRL